MDVMYLANQLINLINAPIHRFDRQNGHWEHLGERLGPIVLKEKDEELVEKFFMLKDLEYPVIGSMGKEMVYITLRDSKDFNQFYVLGPCFSSPIDDDKKISVVKSFREMEKLDLVPVFCPLDSMISAILILYSNMYGKELSLSDFWEVNTQESNQIKKIPSMLTEHIFTTQENQAKHNPYDQELRELESIENGDVFSLNKSISETYEGQIGTLAKDPLRHHKNVAIGNITLASRAAVKGGLSAEMSFSMADKFIQQVEEISSIPEVEMFKREAQRTYARTVADEGREKKESQNALVEGVKDYIFSHLHDNIKITDIADYLSVNPDYLSHLFSVEEGITIKRYMLEEKIKRAKNLLKYSDHSIQEIAFYLGFSSQSYFTQLFQQIVGYTPATYRKSKKPKT